MEAKVKSEYRWNIVTAFGGIEFVKSEFRKVPAGFEKEAQAHPCLEINDGSMAEAKQEKTPEEKAAWAAKMVKARADKKAKGG